MYMNVIALFLLDLVETFNNAKNNRIHQNVVFEDTQLIIVVTNIENKATDQKAKESNEKPHWVAPSSNHILVQDKVTQTTRTKMSPLQTKQKG